MDGGEVASVCTMMTGECADEFMLFYDAFRAFHPTTPLYVATTSPTKDERVSRAVEAVQASLAGIPAAEREHYVRFYPLLEQYLAIDGGISRDAMTRHKGFIYQTRHCDFMMEKSVIMELALQKHPNTLFVDCDVLFLDTVSVPVSSSSTDGARIKVGLSPHLINESDEALFGMYNGGFVYCADPDVLVQWRRHTQTSRFHDQASLEDVANIYGPSVGSTSRMQPLHDGLVDNALYLFPSNVNYGYWRLMQCPKDRAGSTLQSIRLCRDRGVLVSGRPLQSVHTHFLLPRDRCGRSVSLFNRLVLKWMADSNSAKYKPILETISALRAAAGVV